MATVINLGMERCPIAEFAVPFIDANGPLGDRTLGIDVPEDFEPLPSVASLSRTNTLPPYNIFEETKSSVQFTAGASAYVFRLHQEVLLVEDLLHEQRRAKHRRRVRVRVFQQ